MAASQTSIANNHKKSFVCGDALCGVSISHASGKVLPRNFL